MITFHQRASRSGSCWLWRSTIRVQLRVADHFGKWLCGRKDIQAASLSDVDAYMRRHGCVKRGEGRALVRLFAIMEQEGTVFRNSKLTNTPRDAFLQRFAD